MTSPESSSPLELAVVGAIGAGIVFAIAIGEYSAAPHHAPIIIAVLAVMIGVLTLTTIELIKHRNLHVDRARASGYNYQLQRKRADRLNDENKRYFNAYMSHVPAEVMVHTLASMGDGPIRIRDVGPETAWYKVATSSEYRHLFNEDDVRKLESQARTGVDQR